MGKHFSAVLTLGKGSVVIGTGNSRRAALTNALDCAHCKLYGLPVSTNRALNSHVVRSASELLSLLEAHPSQKCTLSRALQSAVCSSGTAV